MKFKFFEDVAGGNLENEINKWIEEEDDSYRKNGEDCKIKIIDIKYSTNIGNHDETPFFSSSAVVLYELV